MTLRTDNYACERADLRNAIADQGLSRARINGVDEIVHPYGLLVDPRLTRSHRRRNNQYHSPRLTMHDCHLHLLEIERHLYRLLSVTHQATLCCLFVPPFLIGFVPPVRKRKKVFPYDLGELCRARVCRLVTWLPSVPELTTCFRLTRH